MIVDKYVNKWSGNEIVLELETVPQYKLHEAGTIAAAIATQSVSTILVAEKALAKAGKIKEITAPMFKLGLIDLAYSLREDLNTGPGGPQFQEKINLVLPSVLALGVYSCLQAYSEQTVVQAAPQFRDWNSEGAALSRMVDGVLAGDMAAKMATVLNGTQLEFVKQHPFGFVGVA